MFNWQPNFKFIFKVVFCLLGFLFLGSFGITQNLDALDQQEGFFNIKLGSSLDTLKGFEPQGKYQKKDRYISKNLPKEYAGIKLTNVIFLFYRKQLHSIEITIEESEFADQFLELLELYYGPGKQETMAKYFEWEGKYVSLTYEQNLLTKKCTVIFKSKEVDSLFKNEYREYRH